jgi:ribosomal protein S16
MTIENLKLAIRGMASVLNETILELDTLQKKYDELKLDERRYYQWWHDETKETDRLKGILEKTGMASEPVEADEQN